MNALGRTSGNPSILRDGAFEGPDYPEGPRQRREDAQ